jgi:methylisocitrate lyase
MPAHDSLKPRLSPGARMRAAVAEEKPLQVVGTVNAYCALLAEGAGFRTLYLSGAGVANASFGLPDLGITTLDNVLEDARRITAATELPLLVDIDTGFGGVLNIGRTVKEMIRAGVAGVHIEDQVPAKRCGHRPRKAVVPKEEMVDRIKAAVDARSDPSFVIMARTDALAVEGIQSAIDRAIACREGGADMIFPEALTELAQYRSFADAVGVPILANITEFGQTPLYNAQELCDAGVGLVLYPLSAFRAMSRAAEAVYATIRRDGTQQAALESMQTREELYHRLGYHDYERKLDEF